MQKQNVAVLTDLEPDDCLALEIFARRPDINLVALIGGEGNATAKKGRLEKFVETHGLSSTTTSTLAGISSSKLFPGETPKRALGRRSTVNVCRHVPVKH